MIKRRGNSVIKCWPRSWSGLISICGIIHTHKVNSLFVLYSSLEQQISKRCSVKTYYKQAWFTVLLPESLFLKKACLSLEKKKTYSELIIYMLSFLFLKGVCVCVPTSFLNSLAVLELTLKTRPSPTQEICLPLPPDCWVKGMDYHSLAAGSFWKAWHGCWEPDCGLLEVHILNSSAMAQAPLLSAFETEDLNYVAQAGQHWVLNHPRLLSAGMTCVMSYHTRLYKYLLITEASYPL